MSILLTTAADDDEVGTTEGGDVLTTFVLVVEKSGSGDVFFEERLIVEEVAVFAVWGGLEEDNLGVIYEEVTPVVDVEVLIVVERGPVEEVGSGISTEKIRDFQKNICSE